MQRVAEFTPLRLRKKVARNLTAASAVNTHSLPLR